MKRTLTKLSTVGLAIVVLFSACQKDQRVGRLELLAEGMGGGTKMLVSGLASYWQTGDKVIINGEQSTITANATSANVDGEFSADDYCIVFPASIYQNSTGGTVTLKMPSTYYYSSVSNPARQIVNAPMAYYGSAEGGSVLMKHLTGALNIQITGRSGVYVDCITVSTLQNHVLSGEMSFDLSDLQNVSSSAANAVSNNYIQMLFPQNFISGTVQIPVPVLSGNVNFTIRVDGHDLYGHHYIFENTQATGGHLGRGIIAQVGIDMNSSVQSSSALFETTQQNGKTYYMLSTPKDFLMMSKSMLEYGYSYRDEDGDRVDVDVEWEYGGLKYYDANYLVTNSFDMAWTPMKAINRFKGDFNGGGHTIHNLDVSTGDDYEWGLFVNGDVKVVENITFDGLKVTGETADEYPVYGGALSGGGHVRVVSNVHINNFTVGRTSNYCLWLGGFFGSGGGPVHNSSVSFTPNQTITGSNYYVRYLPPTRLGGVSGYWNNPAEVENTFVNFNNMNFRSTYAQTNCHFGGVFTSGHDSYNLSVDDLFSNVTIIGNVTIGGTTIFTGKVYTAGSGQTVSVNSLDGVDVSGLTVNGN